MTINSLNQLLALDAIKDAHDAEQDAAMFERRANELYDYANAKRLFAKKLRDRADS